jgi:hypothetical protein
MKKYFKPIIIDEEIEIEDICGNESNPYRIHDNGDEEVIEG